MIGINLVIALLIFSCLYVLQLFFNKSIFVKLINITFLFVFSSLIYFSFETYKGWPSKIKIPKGYLVSVMIIQPTQGSPGGIYAWVVHTEEKDLNTFERLITYKFDVQPSPRSYYIPYSKSANKAFGDAEQKMKEGNIVLIDGQGEPSEGQDGQGEGGTKDKKGMSNSGDATEYKVPNLTIISPESILKK